jgi:endonuclease-3 related protein
MSKKHAFEVCVGAILTQNTAWKNVEKALANLSQAARGKLDAQFVLSCGNLEELIWPAGYYNQKAKKLRIFSDWRMNNRHLQKISPTALRLQLTALWGIGPETADSMLLYAFGKLVFVVDAYTRRLCKECGVAFETYDEYREFFEAQLPKSVKLFNEYHALIVAWGKLYSKDKPLALKVIK